MYHYLFNIAFNGGIMAAQEILKQNPSIITKEFRGNNYAHVPIMPSENTELAISSIATLGKKFKSEHSIKRIKGRFIHKLYNILFNEANKVIVTKKIIDLVNFKSELDTIRDKVLDINNILSQDEILKKNITKEAKKLKISIHEKNNGSKYSPEFESISNAMKKIWDYESSMLVTSVIFHIVNCNNLGVDNTRINKQILLKLALPFLPEHEIDGTRIGLSGRSCMDIFVSYPIKTILEIKTGEEDFDTDCLQVAGYALAYESQFGEDIDIGCIMYIKLNDSKPWPLIRCRTFVIDKDMRNRFLINRDKMIEQKRSRK